MWFVGMLVGAVIGAIGNGAGVVIGGIVGIILGALVGNKLKQGRVADTRIASLEDAVKQLNERMKAFEGGAVNAPAVASPSTTLSVLPPVPDVPVPVTAVVQSVPSPVFSPEPALSEPMGHAPVPTRPQQPKEPFVLWNFFFGGNTLVRVGISRGSRRGVNSILSGLRLPR